MPSILDQLLGNGGMQEQPNIAQQILSARFQPSPDDVGQMAYRNAVGSSNPNYVPISPQQVAGQNQMAMIQPYDEALQAQGRQIQNNIQQQTGLPMAQADLQKQLMANNIQQQTGLPLAQAQLQNAQTANQYQGQGLQADIANKNAMAGYYGNSLQRDLAEKAFDYQNNPQMAQARMMMGMMQNYANGGQPAQLPSGPTSFPTGGMSTPSGPVGPSLPQALQQNAQPTQQQSSGYSPMGAMMGKALGLPEGMQLGPNGQPIPIPGIPTKGQQEEDNNFAQSWQSYINEGGDKRLQNSLDTIDKVIGQLKSGNIETGGIGSRAMTNPEGEPIMGAQLVNPNALVGRNLIASAILPQAKALFGSRVTNFDAQSLISSQGLDLMADPQTNIDKLQRLKNATVIAQKELNNSGKYFQQHGTLSGYNPTPVSAIRVSVVSPDGQAGTIAPEELQSALANGWKQAQ